MRGKDPKRTRGRTATCPHCREEFMTYTALRSAQCPSCGRRVHPASPGATARRVLLALAVLAALAGAAAFFWLRR